MASEEVCYWFSETTDHRVGRRSQKAMRILQKAMRILLAKNKPTISLNCKERREGRFQPGPRFTTASARIKLKRLFPSFEK